MKIRILSLIFLLAPLFSSYAENCKGDEDYASIDEFVVRSFFNSTTDFLLRLNEISSSVLRYDHSFNSMQLLEFEEEFNQIKRNITSIGDNANAIIVGFPPRPLKPTTVCFLGRVVDSKFLGIEESSVHGRTPQMARENAHLANLLITAGVAELWKQLKG